MRTKIVNTLNRIVSDSVFGAWAISITAEEAQWILDNLKPEPQGEPPIFIKDPMVNTWTDLMKEHIDKSEQRQEQMMAQQRKRDIAQMAAVIFPDMMARYAPSVTNAQHWAVVYAEQLYDEVSIR